MLVLPGLVWILCRRLSRRFVCHVSPDWRGGNLILIFFKISEVGDRLVGRQLICSYLGGESGSLGAVVCGTYLVLSRGDLLHSEWFIARAHLESPAVGTQTTTSGPGPDLCKVLDQVTKDEGPFESRAW